MLLTLLISRLSQYDRKGAKKLKINLTLIIPARFCSPVIAYVIITDIKFSRDLFRNEIRREEFYSRQTVADAILFSEQTVS